jgi:hypothetical protein
MNFDLFEQAALSAACLRTSVGAMTKVGDLCGAYAQIDNRPVAEVAQIMLRSGFSVIAPPSVKFMAYMQSQLAEAARHRVDGFGLRELKDARLACCVA